MKRVLWKTFRKNKPRIARKFKEWVYDKYGSARYSWINLDDFSFEYDPRSKSPVYLASTFIILACYENGEWMHYR